jgi:hypothetical protein
MPMTISTMALSKNAGMWWCDTRHESHADTIMQRLTIPPRKGSIHEREEKRWFGDISCLRSTQQLPLLSRFYHARCTKGTPDRDANTRQGGIIMHSTSKCTNVSLMSSPSESTSYEYTTH